MTICMGYDLKSGTKCTRTAVFEVLAGCVHEHIGWRDLCDWHADDIGHPSWPMRCGTCAEAGCSCVLHEVRRRPVAGVVLDAAESEKVER